MDHIEILLSAPSARASVFFFRFLFYLRGGNQTFSLQNYIRKFLEKDKVLKFSYAQIFLCQERLCSFVRGFQLFPRTGTVHSVKS